MKNKFLLLGVLGLSLCGCQLNISYDKVDMNVTEISTLETEPITTEKSETETEAETAVTTASEIIMTIASEAQSAIESASDEQKKQISIDSIPDMELPIDKNGNWTDNQIIIYELFHHEYVTGDDGDFGKNGVVYNIANYPNIAVKGDIDKQKEFNDKIVQYLYNDFNYRFQMYNIDFELNCYTHHEKSRFVSFEVAGEVFHNGGDSKYQEEKEYRFYFTIDRMTLEKINLGTAYGIDKAASDIKNGNYTVVSAQDSVFEVYSNELLARVFRDEPMFSDDSSHYLDFYYSEDGKVCVCIWVGNEHGGYAILKLNGDSELLEKKDRSVEKKTETETETEAKTETEETAKS